jgi:iron-sulfur cluster repair protein YtfE (RIC family)
MEFATMSITTPLSQHHKQCDEIFARAEKDCADGDWAAGEKVFARLHGQLENHFTAEEEILFPAFEESTGMTSGPTEMMRREHRQMRDLLSRMQLALQARDQDAFGGDAETLLILMQQHNLKEENILYPMCDNVLGNSDLGDSLALRLNAA